MSADEVVQVPKGVQAAQVILQDDAQAYQQLQALFCLVFAGFTWSFRQVVSVCPVVVCLDFSFTCFLFPIFLFTVSLYVFRLTSFVGAFTRLRGLISLPECVIFRMP